MNREETRQQEEEEEMWRWQQQQECEERAQWESGVFARPKQVPKVITED